MALSEQEPPIPTASSHSSISSISNPDHHSRSRWHMLAIYMVLGLINQSLWLSFAPAPAMIARRYRVSEQSISGVAILSNILFLPGSWLAAKILKKSGLGHTIMVACWLQMGGSLLRWSADLLVTPMSGPFAFLLICIGQGITALASPFIMNTPAVFAEAWFGRQDRETAVAAGTLSPIFGQGVGSAVAGFLISGSEAGAGQLIAGQAVLSCAIAAWAACSFHVPSVMRPAASDATSSTCGEWSQLMCRPNFAMLLIVFDCGLGLAAAVLTLFGEIAEKCGYQPAQSGAASGLYMLGGIAGSMGAGALLGATRAYRTILRISIVLAVAGGCIFLAMLRPGNVGGLLVTTAVFGMFMMSALPSLISNAVEETFPLPAEASTGLLFISAIAMQVFLTPLTQLVLQAQGDRCSSWGSPFCMFVLAVAAFGCLLPVVLYRGQNNRTLAECQAESEHLAVSARA